MSVNTNRDPRVAVAQELYAALAVGDRDTLNRLLHPGFVGHAAEGMPLGMGGEHRGPEAMQRNLWWRIGENFRIRAQPSDFHARDDGKLIVAGRYVGAARRTGHPLDAAFVHIIGFSLDGRIDSLDQLTDTAAWHAALDRPDRLQTIDYAVSDGLATVCLKRGAERNAINMQLARETLSVAECLIADKSVRAVLILGDGPSLSVGGDIGEFLGAPAGAFGDLLVEMTTPFHRAFDVLSRLDVPIVTAAHGSVAGGGLGYIYAADIVIAAEGTQFVTAFARLGLSGDGGGTWHLPRLIGPRRATAAYLRNRPISDAEALEWGLINELVPAGELRERSFEVATQLTHGPTVAFAKMRALLRDSWQSELSTQLAAETRALKATGDSADAASAIAAFAAKRTPQFTGR
jgi:2-(1,2-epoxy-1,2-dihydrophenyl)acetyl-CoA isomerase